MPHTTHAYGFEARVCGFAIEIGARFTTGGRESGRTFLLVLDRNGNVSSLSFSDSSREWRENAWSIVKSEAPHLFYDPLDDGMEYIWLSWKGIEQSVMERLIGQRFEEADFLPIPAFARRAAKLDPEKQLPQSWGVMF
jgi:hypothetical protein